jgi:hypothetical protein
MDTSAEIQTLFNKTPKIINRRSDFHHLPYEKPAAEGRNIARSNRILSESGRTTVISTQGVDRRMSEVVEEGAELWQFDSMGDRFSTKGWMKLINAGFKPEFVCHKRSDENKLWGFLEEEIRSDEVVEEFGEIDINNLNPYQALFIVTQLIKKRMKYDHLAGLVTNDVPEDARKDEGRLQTDEKWAKRAKKEPTDKLADKRYKDLNGKSAEQLLDEGWGVCAHFSAISSHLYDLLKERQKGLGLNGSYLLYWNEGSALELAMTTTAYNNTYERHAMNILVVTRPPGQTDPEMEVGVIDYTTSIGLKDLMKPEQTPNPELDPVLKKLESRLSIDQTFLNIPTAISFVKKFGHIFSVADPEKESVSLAENTLERVDRRPDRLIESFGYDAGLDSFAALLTLSDSDKKGTVIKDLDPEKRPSIMYASHLYDIPAISFPINGVRHIKKEYIIQLSEYLDNLDFNLSPHDNRREEAATLLGHMIDQYHSRYQFFKGKLKKYFKETNYDYLVKQIIRMMVGLMDRNAIKDILKTPEGKTLFRAISHGIKSSSRVHKGLIEDELVNQYNSLFK